VLPQIFDELVRPSPLGTAVSSLGFIARLGVPNLIVALLRRPKKIRMTGPAFSAGRAEQPKTAIGW
jgi:hypothetical protein